MSNDEVISQIIEKYGEWFEMAGDQAPVLLIQTLARLLIKEREEKEYYKGLANARAK